MRRSLAVPSLSLLAILAACGGREPTPFEPPPCDTGTCVPVPPPPPPPPAFTLALAGNIARSGNEQLTARILDTLGAEAQFVTLGDNARCSSGTYASCFDVAWGRFKSRIRPAIGNHEYDAPNTAAEEHFSYWGAAAGDPGKGYYAFDAGTWRVIVLNVTDESRPGGLGPSFNTNSDQLNWLTAELTASASKKCTLVAMHNGYFLSSDSSTATGPWNTRSSLRSLYQMLQNFGVDVVVSANEHRYERFAPMTADGVRDSTWLRSFNVGTGGESIARTTPLFVNSGSEKLITEYGVLRFRLSENGYEYTFINAVNASDSDTGTGACR